MPARQPPLHRPARGLNAPAPIPPTSAFLVTCEHGGREIPEPYREYFAQHDGLLAGHRGYDPGALALARELADALHAPLLWSSTSRLLVDLNRSPTNPARFSAISRTMPPALRAEVQAHHYQPYRLDVEQSVDNGVRQHGQVVHISSHSFTPVLDGRVRNADVGFLYDPRRPAEAALCERWLEALQLRNPALRLRRNYPYAGRSDGFCTWLRRHHDGSRYLGVELEVNQRHATAGGPQWTALRADIVAALLQAVGRTTGEMRAGGASRPGVNQMS